MCRRPPPLRKREGGYLYTGETNLCLAQALLLTTTSPPFFLRDSRVSEMLVRLKITPREKRRHAAGGRENFFRVSLVLLSLGKNGGLLVV